jgi:hypothetical protein
MSGGARAQTTDDVLIQVPNDELRHCAIIDSSGAESGQGARGVPPVGARRWRRAPCCDVPAPRGIRSSPATSTTRIPAPWVHRDEATLYDLKKSALAMNVPLEVVVGNAPGWSDPWSRARLAHVEQEPNGWSDWLLDEDGYVIDENDVQRARLSATLH